MFLINLEYSKKFDNIKTIKYILNLINKTNIYKIIINAKYPQFKQRKTILNNFQQYNEFKLLI